MKYFETRFSGGRGVETLHIPLEHEALWSAAFESPLDEIFDLDPPQRAIPKFDAAIAKFNHDPESLRALCVDGPLVRKRKILEQLRTTLADHPDATISGAINDENE